MGRWGARELRLAGRVEEALEAISNPSERRKLKAFLRSLASPLANGLLEGRWRSFSDLPLDSRTEVLRGWMGSRLNLRRQAFQAVKRLALFLYYSATDGGENPTWSVFEYESPPGSNPGLPRAVETGGPAGQSSLRAEVLIVGSGAGGAVVAAELAEAGHDVLVLEKGGHNAAPDFHGRELKSNADMFEKRGALTTDDLGTVVLAGSTLGGGTVVNWSTSLPTPMVVREEWEQEYQFDGLAGSEYERSLWAVMGRMNVNRQESEANPQNRLLARGAAALRTPAQVVPRNVKGCVDCTYCAFGCRHDAKQSSLLTFLPDAQRAGARIMVNAHVDRILTEAGRAIGAVVTVESDGGRRQRIVHADAVVVSAGAIHTPALLLRSGLRNPNLGRHLRLHPVTAPIGVYQEPVRSWQGAPQTRMVDALADLDGEGYGVRLEVAPAHPGLWASALPWVSGADHKALMAGLEHTANFIVITRDRGSGRVVLDGDGEPVIRYRLGERDRAHLMEGVGRALKMHRAAGAHTILSPHALPRIYRREEGGFGPFCEAALDAPAGPNQLSLFSAHQMGTARVAGSAKRGAVRPDGATWEIDNIYVADGSVFPTACGVNPMVPIAGTAHFLASRIAASL